MFLNQPLTSDPWRIDTVAEIVSYIGY